MLPSYILRTGWCFRGSRGTGQSLSPITHAGVHDYMPWGWDGVKPRRCQWHILFDCLGSMLDLCFLSFLRGVAFSTGSQPNARWMSFSF